MKIRVRLGATTKVIAIDDEVATHVQLSELRTLIQQSFDDELIGPFSLSLNKVDVFKNEEATLKDCDIVSGDLIHILADNPFAGPDAKKSRAPAKQTDLNEELEKKTSIPESSEKTMDITPEEKVECEEEEKEANSKIGTCQDEVWLCREATNDKVPLQLQNLLSASSASNKHQAFVVVLHQLMLETGFQFCHPSPTTGVSSPTVSALSCNTREHQKRLAEILQAPGFYKLHYTLPECDGVLCLMTCIPMASQLVVDGKIMGVKIENDSQPRAIFECNDYINEVNTDSVDSTYRNLPKLSCSFKDSFAHHMLSELRYATGIPNYTGLSGIHYDILLKIMGYLDVGSLLKLSEVCRHFRDISHSPQLWRRLFQIDFKSADCQSHNKDWFEEYKRFYKFQKSKRYSAMRTEYEFYDRRVPPFNRNPPPPPFRTIGGDYDLMPEFFDIESRSQLDPLAHALNRGRPQPGPQFPHGFGGGRRGRGEGGFGSFHPRMC